MIGLSLVATVFWVVVLCLGLEFYLQKTHAAFLPLMVDREYHRATAQFPYSAKYIYTYRHTDFNRLPDQPSKSELNFRPDTKPNGQATDADFTILTLGDSVTYGHLVYDTETYPAQLESLLTERGYQVNVFNAAVPGYCPDQYALQTAELAQFYRPELIIVNLNVNDLTDTFGVCLFQKKGVTLQQVAAEFHSLYYQAWLVDHAPAWLRNSLVFNRLLRAITFNNERVNLRCGYPHNPDHRFYLDKINLLIQRIKATVPAETKLLFTLVPNQSFFVPTDSPLQTPLSLQYRYDRDSLIELPELVNLIDLNQVIADNGYTQERAEPLFLTDQIEEGVNFGNKHLSAQGNGLVATLLAEYIQLHYALPTTPQP